MNQQHHSEEIDIIQFFRAIGDFFKSIFNGIKNLFLSLFYFILDVILYFKKNYIYLIAGTVLGLLLAFFMKEKKDTYSVEVMARTNYKAQLKLKESFEAFNHLIKDKNYKLLAQEMGTGEDKALHFTNFDIEPVFDDVLLVDDYADYLKTKDTIFYKFIQFEDYKNSRTDNPDLNNYWKLTVTANAPDVFMGLDEVLKKIVSDKEIAGRQQNYMLALNAAKEKNLKTLQDIDTMRHIFNKVIVEMAKSNYSSTTNIVVNSDKMRGPEEPYNLFEERANALENLERAVLKYNKYASALVFLNAVPTYGIKDTGLLSNPYVKYPLLGFMLALLLVFLIDFNKYLVAYQRKKQV